MKLTLIKPNIGRMENSTFIDGARMEPLSLAVVAGLTPMNVDVELFDDLYEEIPYDKATDLVAITVQTFTARRSYEIASEYRKRGVRVVMGGFHPSLIPEEVSLHADAIVTGDAETVWAQVIDDARSNHLNKMYAGRMGGIPQAGIVPRRAIFKGKNYLPITPVQFGRGCKYACNYCAVSVYFNHSHFIRPADEVAREIAQQDRKLIIFVDDNIVADRQAAKDLFRTLVPLRIKWASQASIDMVQDPELMDLMVESGCIGNLIGFESLTLEALQSIKKTPNLKSFDRYEKAIETFRKYGLLTFAFFMLGLDSDTPESIYKMFDFALHCKFTFAGFSILMPYPRTPLYSKLKEEGRLLYDGKWWIHPDYHLNHAAFRPAHMSAEELTQIGEDLRSKWSSTNSILYRFLEPKTNMHNFFNMASYWTYNPLFKKEAIKKRGLHLGNA